MEVKAVIQVFEREDGTKQYMPCLMVHRKGQAPSAGEIVAPENRLFDSLDEANARAEVLLEELLSIMENVAQSVKNGNT